MVAPKQESLDKAEAELAAQMATLHQKRAELKEVTDKLQALQDNLTTKQSEKKVQCLLLSLISSSKWIGGYDGAY